MTGRQASVAYLMKRFPRLSETFILDEILGLEAAEVRLRLFSLADPREAIVQPDVAKVTSAITYLHRNGKVVGAAGGANPIDTVRDAVDFARAHARVFRRHPRRYGAVLLYVARKRRHMSTLKHLVEAGLLADAVEREGCGHVHAAFAHGPASVAHFVHLLTGVPFSFAAHAKDLYLSAPDLLGRKVAAARFVLVCSSSAAREMARIVCSHPEASVRSSVEKIVLAPHGVDVDRFRPRHGGGDGDGGGRPAGILAVGRLVPKKGYPVLVEALAELAASGARFHCRIVGGGPMKEQLSSAISAAGLQDKVELVGALSQQQIADEYLEADVFVQSSVVVEGGDRDGIPNSVLEAMASGLAVVGSDVAGIPEVVSDGSTGMLVESGNPSALASALSQLVKDPSLRRRLGSAARERMVTELSREACIRPVAERFRQALEGASAPSGSAGGDSGGGLPHSADQSGAARFAPWTDGGVQGSAGATHAPLPGAPAGAADGPAGRRVEVG
ncbi:MAG: glycosyltransferase family 4 protein [Actinomycetota bacterium]|nr:glycosyltransferase family 4 protein [Actinomycetota bacterium]